MLALPEFRAARFLLLYTLLSSHLPLTSTPSSNAAAPAASGAIARCCRTALRLDLRCADALMRRAASLA
jgi:hypothetical protein